MSNISLKPATLSRGLLLCFGIVLAINIATVFIDVNQLGKDTYDTNKELERVETEIMSNEHCFPECTTQFASNERWKSLQQRLSYYERAEQMSFFEKLKEEVIQSDILYILASIVFLILIIASKLL